MMQTIEFEVDITEDRVIHAPAEVPVGHARVLVLVPERSAEPPDRDRIAEMRRLAYGMDEGKGFQVPDDFDAPLPPDIQRYFEGESDPEDHMDLEVP